MSAPPAPFRLPQALAVHALAVVALLLALGAAGVPLAAFRDSAWWWPFWTVQAGVVVGLVAVARLGARPDEHVAVAEAGRREDLLRSRELVVAQLRQLEAEAHKLDPADYARERAELLAVGAGAARALDQADLAHGASTPAHDPTDGATQEPTPAASELAARLRAMRQEDPAAFDAAVAALGIPGAAPAAASGPSGVWIGAGWTLAGVAVIAGLYVLVAGDARPRAEGMPITGGDSVGLAEAPAPRRSPAEQALLDRVAQDPADVGAHNDLTELAIGRQDLAGALEHNQAALAAAPADADARVFRAVLLTAIRKEAEGIALLDEVLADDPRHVRALVYKALLVQRRDPATAVSLLERAAAVEPSPQIEAALAEARAAAAAGPGAEGTALSSSDAPGGGPPPSDAPARTLVAGTLAYAGTPAPDAILFVSLRPVAGGPPLAAVRWSPDRANGAFTLTTADLIPMAQGRPLPEAVVVTARLDSDGDPLSRPPSDPAASAEVTVGAEGVTLTLAPAG